MSWGRFNYLTFSIFGSLERMSLCLLRAMFSFIVWIFVLIITLLVMWVVAWTIEKSERESSAGKHTQHTVSCVPTPCVPCGHRNIFKESNHRCVGSTALQESYTCMKCSGWVVDFWEAQWGWFCSVGPTWTIRTIFCLCCLIVLTKCLLRWTISESQGWSTVSITLTSALQKSESGPQVSVEPKPFKFSPLHISIFFWLNVGYYIWSAAVCPIFRSQNHIFFIMILSYKC